MKDKTRQILIHVAGSLSFLALAFIPNFQGRSDTFINPMSVKEVISYSLLILVFYINYFLTVPRLYFARRYGWYFVSVAALYILFQTFVNLAGPQAPPQRGSPPPAAEFAPGGPPRRQMGPPPHEMDLFIDLNRKIFPFLVVVFFSLMLRISIRWQQTEKEKINTELSYLKAQINPHFLFNTLNSIYSLAIEKSDETPTAVVKLSGMMRYVLSESANDFVSLEKEINYIRHYIDLQKIRFGETIPVLFHVGGIISGQKIAPLVLIPFIENAFKHGVNAEEDALIKTEIAVQNEHLTLTVYNRKVVVSISEENRSGIGVENTKNRLSLLYPRKHLLEIRDTPEDYLVTLQLDLS